MTQCDDLVRMALGEVGESYSKHRDCSGFTAWAYRQIGVTIPEGSVAQFGVGKRVDTNSTELQPGDLLFWDTFGPAPGHVALYVGDGDVVHALNEQRGIVRSHQSANMGGPYMGARRILTDDTPTPPAPIEDTPQSKHPRRPRKVRRLVHQKERP